MVGLTLLVALHACGTNPTRTPLRPGSDPVRGLTLSVGVLCMAVVERRRVLVVRTP